MNGTVLDFDTEWFGIKVGRYDDDPLLAHRWALENEIELLYTLVPMAKVKLADIAIREGSRIVDVRVEFSAPTKLGPWYVRLATDDDLDELSRIARTSFQNTRFYNDVRLPRERVDALYENWLRESYKDGSIIVAPDEEDNPDGFVTVDKAGDIGLIAVRDGLRKRGLGFQLVTAALDLSFDEKHKMMNVVTQSGNIGAQRTFQKAGFRSTRTDIWLHRWFS